MIKVTAQMSLSLDGCYAGPRFDAEPGDMAGWMAGTEAPGFFRITRWAIDAHAWRQRQGFAGGEDDVNSTIIDQQFESAGAYVMGRRMFDGGELPWGDEPPFRAPVFVATSTPKETLHKQGGTSFTFVTDGLAAAVDAAKAAAGAKDVAIAGGGTLLRAALAEGLVDELFLHVAPVILGDGQRLFPDMGLDAWTGIELTPVEVVADPAVTHVRYRVDGPAKLELDARGSDEGALDR